MKSGKERFRIGIDLDNTIVSYNRLFCERARSHGWLQSERDVSKDKLKQTLNRAGALLGEQRWQLLQSEVYGKAILGAHVFDGFRAFAKEMRAQSHELFIVSHKSHFSSYDSRVDLWYWARKYMECNSFFEPVECGGLGFEDGQVFFEETRKAKLNRMHSLALSHFIDDLTAVLGSCNFPKYIQPILFHDKHPQIPYFSTWVGIKTYFLAAGELSITERTIQFERLDNDGNNALYQLQTEDDNWLVKYYLQDGEDRRPRRESEFAFSSQLWNRGLKRIAQPLRTGDQVSLFQYIEGKRVDWSDHSNEVLQFLLELERVGRALPSSQLGPAADARFRLNDFICAVDRRIQSIMEAKENGMLLKRLLKKCLSCIEKAKNTFYRVCSEEEISPLQNLPESLWYPSPSDFGEHNCLQISSGELIFLDFEYAGWDDPAKLLCDFRFHVGFQLQIEIRDQIIQSFIKARHHDPTLGTRVRAIQDLVAIEWVLIVLNVFVPSQARRKAFSMPQRSFEDLCADRLAKAERMLKDLARDL